MLSHLPILRGFVLSLLLLTALGALLPVQAQNTVSGTIVGSVRDRKTNALLPATRVKIVNEANGRVRSTISNAQGEYRLPFLPEGSYAITANKETYLPETLSHFPVQFGQYNSVGGKYHKLVVDIKLSRPSLSGQVSNDEGDALSGVEVIVTNEQTADANSVVTDADGGYEISDLPVGRYSVTAAGNAQDRVSLPVQLDREEVLAPTIILVAGVSGEQAQTPTGQGASASPPDFRQATEGEKNADLVRAVDAVRSANFGDRQIGALPLGGATYMRSFDELALLVVGVAPPPYTPGARGPGVGFGIGTAGQFSVNGMRARSNNFSVDGSDNNDADVGVRRQGFVVLVPQSVESVDGLSVVTLLWDAELGRNAGGQINAVSKSGVNQFHGQAYGFFNDSRLNARNFFDYSGGAAGGKDPFTRTQAGAAVGGPIRKDRTHFFASFEREKINASAEQHFAVPTAAERRFLDLSRFGFSNSDRFSAFAFSSLQNFDRSTPLGANIFSLYPLPNHQSGPYGANAYTQILPAGGDGKIASLRATQQFAESHSFNARYNFTDDGRMLPSVNRAIGSTLESETRSHNLSLVFDSAMGPTRFNQARFSFGRTRLHFLGRAGSPFIFGKSSTETIRIPQGNFPFTSQTGPIGELLIEPYSPVGVGTFYLPQDRASNTFQYADTFTWLLGSHQLKLGGNVRRYHLNSRLDRLYRPQVVYAGGLAQVGQVVCNTNGTHCLPNPDGSTASLGFIPDAGRPPAVISGVQLASLGTASAVLQTITSGAPDSTVGLRFNEYQLFANDNWRVRPNFTLDYGLRYEYNSVPHSSDKRIESSLVLENLLAQGDSRFNSRVRTDKFNAAVNAYRRVLDGRNRIYDPDKNNFGPHVGFAWSPGKEGKTAVRGGYGVYYDAILGAVVTQSRNVFPREIPINVDPSFLQFDAYSLNNPANLRIVQDAQGNFTNPVDLLRAGACNQFGTCNQFGGTPADFVALIGLLFKQNEPGGGLAFTLPEKNLRTPYAQHWHLTIEREFFNDYFFSAAYVGTKGTKLTRLVTPNLGQIVTPYITLANSICDLQAGCTVQPGQTVPSTPTSTFSSPIIFNSFLNQSLVGSALTARPNVNLGAYQIYENSAASNYHALQLEARKRYNQGYQFTAAYAWSHAIDDVSDVFTLAGAPIPPQDLKNLRAERGNANFDVRHRFSGSVIWDLPFWANVRGRAARVLGGWQIAGIFQAQSGQPFTLGVPFDANFDGNLSDRPSTMNGLSISDGHGPCRVGCGQTIDTAKFFTVGQPGAVGRNTLRGDGFINLDVALNKQFRFTERQALEFRAEFFNALNRANFGLPVRTIGAPGFGSAVETINPARIVQFALKYRF